MRAFIRLITGLLCEGIAVKCHHENFFFLRKYLAHRMYKPVPIEEKFQKT